MTKRLFITTLILFSIASGKLADATEIADHDQAIPHAVELTTAQQREVQHIYKAYCEKTRSLREELWAKKTMLRALTSNPNAEVNDIQKIVNAMKDLRARLHAERVVFEQGMMKKYGFIPSQHWIDKNDAFHPAGTGSDTTTDNPQNRDDSAPITEGFFSKLFE